MRQLNLLPRPPRRDFATLRRLADEIISATVIRDLRGDTDRSLQESLSSVAFAVVAAHTRKVSRARA